MVKWFTISIEIFIMILIVQCTVGSRTSSSQDLEEICLAELGDRVAKSSSTDSTYILCWKEVEANPKSPVLYFEYIVIKQEPLEVVYRGKVRSGRAVWSSDEELLITEKLGILGQKSQNIRIYRVNIRTKHITNVEQTENF